MPHVSPQWRWGQRSSAPLDQLYPGQLVTSVQVGRESPPAMANGVEQFAIPVDQWELFTQLFSLPKSQPAHFITLPLATAAPTILPLQKKACWKIAYIVFCAECKNNMYPITLQLVYVLPCVSVMCIWPSQADRASACKERCSSEPRDGGSKSELRPG